MGIKSLAAKAVSGATCAERVGALAVAMLGDAPTGSHNSNFAAELTHKRLDGGIVTRVGYDL